MRLRGIGIQTQRLGKCVSCFINSAGILQSGGVIKMSPGTGRKIGGDHGAPIEFAPSRVGLSKPECSQRYHENAYPFRSVQRPAWEKTFCRDIGCPATDAERLS